MSPDRARRLATLAGTFMLLVQLRTLQLFWQLFRVELADLHPITLSTVLAHMSWLRPAPWTQPFLSVWSGLFATLFLVLVAYLWLIGLGRWWSSRGEK